MFRPTLPLLLLPLLAASGCGPGPLEEGRVTGSVSGSETLDLTADTDDGDLVTCQRVTISANTWEAQANGVLLSAGEGDDWSFEALIPAPELQTSVNFSKSVDDLDPYPDAFATFTRGLSEYTLVDETGQARCSASIGADWTEGTLACELVLNGNDPDRVALDLDLDWDCDR